MPHDAIAIRKLAINPNRSLPHCPKFSQIPMASAGFRSLSRASFSPIPSCLSRSKAAARFASSSRSPTAASASPTRGRRLFPPFSRSPAGLGCCSGSLFPLHSAVAVARLISCLGSTTRSCRVLSQDGIDGT